MLGIKSAMLSRRLRDNTPIMVRFGLRLIFDWMGVENMSNGCGEI
jgi:hypothetical protein